LDELTILIFVFGVVLAIVTVVGHGIWVVLSLIFAGSRKLKPSERRPAMMADQRIVCPRCHTPLEIDQQICPVCHWPHTSERSMDGIVALRAMRRQLELVAQALDPESRDQLLAAIDVQERRLVEKALIAAPLHPSATTATPIPPATMPTEPPPEPAIILTPASETLAADGAIAMPPASVPLPERARKYSASRGAAISGVLAEAIPSTEGPKKREALLRLFAAFMEEKNIRWGELVGGLLIVGCSVALVISFWSQIAAQPLLKFVLFNFVTAVLFLVGIYTDRRWKIHTTSHGVLVIATLLVPLNFLAIAAFTQASPPTDLPSLAGEGFSLALFTLLVYAAGRILVPRDVVALAVGVMIPCLMQLLTRRLAAPLVSISTLYALAVAPVVSYLATTSIAIRRRWIVGVGGTAAPAVDIAATEPAAPLSSSLEEQEANRVLMFLGLVSAAALMPLALLLKIVPPLEITLHWLSPLATACGMPALLVGLLFWRRMRDTTHSGLQTAGIAVGALGALIMAGSLVLAWPDPATLMPTAIVTAVVMIAVALWFGIPAAHVPAGAAIAVVVLVGFYLLTGKLAWTLGESTPIKNALLSATSGHVLVPLVALFGGLAWWLRRLGRREDGTMYGLVAAVVAAASLGLVMWFGFARVYDPAGATWTLSIYAVAALVAAVALNRTDAAGVGSALLFAAFVQAIVYRFNPAWQLQQPWIVALLAHATLVALGCVALAIVAGKLGEPSPAVAAHRLAIIRTLAFSAVVASVAAAMWIIATTQATSAGGLAVQLAWLGGVWLVLAALAVSPGLFSAAQVVMVLAILCGVTAAVKTRAWYAVSPHPWLDPWFLEAQAIALAAYCLVLTAIRWAIARWSARRPESASDVVPARLAAGAQLLNTPWPAVDRVVTVATIAVTVLIAIYAILPGAAQELSPTQVVGDRVVTPIQTFEIGAIPHAHAVGGGAWLLLAVVAITLAAGLWERRNDWRLIGLLIAAMAIGPLVAARWEAQVAVASALRWLSAAFFAVVSAAIWIVLPRGAIAFKEPASTSADKTVPNQYPSLALRLYDVSRDLGVAFVVLVHVAIAAYVGQLALNRITVDASVQYLLPWVLVWGLLTGLAGLALRYATLAEQRRRQSTTADSTSAWAVHARWLLLLLAAAPAMILLTFAVGKALDRQPLVGPDPASWFHRIGYEASYGIPLIVIAFTFIGYAVRDRASPFAFAAGLLFNVVATLAVLLRLARGSGALDPVAWITVTQVNAIVASVTGLIWLAAKQPQERVATRRVPSEEFGNIETLAAHPLRCPSLLVTQIALAGALCGMFLIPSTVSLALEWSPLATLPNWVGVAGSWLGWWAIGLAIAATLWLYWDRAISQGFIAIFAGALVSMIALTSLWHGMSDLNAYHVLLGGCCAAAWLLPLATRGVNRLIAGSTFDAPTAEWSAWSVRGFDAAGVWLAIWEYSTLASWWVVGGLLAIAARNVVTAWREGRRNCLWIAAALVALATNVWWLDIFRSAAATFRNPYAFFSVNVLAAAAMAVISVVVERRWANGMPKSQPVRRGIAFHRLAAWAIVATLLLLTGDGLIADLSGYSQAVSWPLAGAAWVAAAIAAMAMLWDSSVRFTVALLYLAGLTAVGMYLDALDLRSPMFHWALANALAAFALAMSGLWCVRDQLRRLAARLGVPVAETVEPRAAGESSSWYEDGGHGWLVSSNFLIGVSVVLLVFWIEQTMANFTQRMVAAYAIGAQAFALGLMAHGAVRTSLQYLALVWGVLFAIAVGWAFLPPDFVAPWLHRLVVTVTALAAVVIVYGFGLVKFLRRENEWTRAAAQLVPWLAALATMLILLVLAIEVAAFAEHANVPMVPAAKIAVALALVGLLAAALVAALLPGRDPLGLSERGRTLYVYAAEALAALLFLHIRVTMPWLFRGWFLRFWPLVVMAIAFLGVGLGEVFQRRRQPILSEPLQTTGAILPLLPVFGFWVMSSQVHYSLLLLSIGALYAALSVLRSSFLYGIMAAVAANGSLWYFLHRREGLDLTEHPQLWLIPPALCALAAGYVNRERLTQEQSAALRYASAIVIYVSSTADIFINGVAEAPWLPAVLAGLSILGVLAGILLRVRAFLYLGTAFLVVALMTIIWHAADQHTWIWWVTGIITGVLIIALFGLFEKRRDDVLRVVEELKHWQA
jgi:hypothetical protein